MFSQKEANNLASLFLILCILFPLNNVNAQTDNSIFSVRKASLSKDRRRPDVSLRRINRRCKINNQSIG